MATTVTIAEVASKIVKETQAYKLPKDAKSVKGMAACADDLYTVVQERYALNKVVDALQAKEALLREHFIENLGKSDATGITGKLARITIKLKTVVSVTDWTEVYGYILKTAKKDPGVWSLLQKRIGDKAVQEMWENGKKLPGTEPLEVKSISMNKVS